MPPQPSPISSNWLVNKINRFHDGHEKIKNAVHSYWRQNTILSPRGRFGKVVMSCFYFSLPVIAGYVVVNQVVEQSEATIQKRFGERGLDRADESSTPSSLPSNKKIGAGGWGGGVNLATSDRKTQDVNRINLERFLKKQRKAKEKREREAAAAEAKDTA